METQEWRFCAVGNVKAQHTDETGRILYGSRAFAGGTKVYIDDRSWNQARGSVSVIGMNRFGQYTTENIPTDLVEHVRMQRIYKPKVLKIMSYVECMDRWVWRGRTAKDRKEVQAFVKMWNRV